MKKRVISAIIAMIISIPFLYFGGIPFYIFGIIVGLLGYREWLTLITKDKLLSCVGYFTFLIIVGINLYKTNFINLLDYRILGLLILLFALTSLLKHKDKNIKLYTYFYVLGMTIFLSSAFSAIIIVRNMSLRYFLFLLLIPILNDTFAHSIGTLFGKHKLNEISPNKSWEGCFGGAVCGVLGSTLFYLISINSEINIFLLIAITLFLSIIGQLGDLFFSQIKRYYKMKDFGNIMPGHGGILDRFDSFIFVVLAFTFLITFL